MSEITPPKPKSQTKPTSTTHTRIYIETLEKLRQLATAWDTTQLEINRYLVDLAVAGEIKRPGA